MWIEKPADGWSEVPMLTFFRCYASAVGSPSRSATEPGDAPALCDVAALNRPAAACRVRRSKLHDSVWRETARKLTTVSRASSIAVDPRRPHPPISRIYIRSIRICQYLNTNFTIIGNGEMRLERAQRR